MQSLIKPNKTHLVESFNELSKTAFLSYYISLYVANIESKGIENTVTVNEIYDFVEDLHRELGTKVPQIDKEDISFCFYVLDKLGLCHCLK